MPPEPALRGQQLALALEQLELQVVRLLGQLPDLLPQRILLPQAPRMLCVQLLPRGDGLQGPRRWETPAPSPPPHPPQPSLCLKARRSKGSRGCRERVGKSSSPKPRRASARPQAAQGHTSLPRTHAPRMALLACGGLTWWLAGRAPCFTARPSAHTGQTTPGDTTLTPAERPVGAGPPPGG